MLNCTQTLFSGNLLLLYTRDPTEYERAVAPFVDRVTVNEDHAELVRKAGLDAYTDGGGGENRTRVREGSYSDFYERSTSIRFRPSGLPVQGLSGLSC